MKRVINSAKVNDAIQKEMVDRLISDLHYTRRDAKRVVDNFIQYDLFDEDIQSVDDFISVVAEIDNMSNDERQSYIDELYKQGVDIGGLF